MKTTKTYKRLKLQKQTVSFLEEDAMLEVRAGAGFEQRQLAVTEPDDPEDEETHPTLHIKTR